MTLRETNIKSLTLLHRGKVRDLYEISQDKLLIVTTDRVSAYDQLLKTLIPDKGIVLTKMTCFWMKKFEPQIKNHLLEEDLANYLNEEELISVLDRAMIVKRCKPLKIEAIVRGCLDGSAWEEYQKSGEISGFSLPSGMKKGDRLSKPLFTPTTKAPVGEKDVRLNFEETEKLLGTELAEMVRKKSEELFSYAASFLKTIGIDLIDTKFEFAMEDGELILIDEVITPDSSRFKISRENEMGLNEGYCDKQIVRNALTKEEKMTHQLPMELSPNVVRLVCDGYRKICEKVCNHKFPKVGVVMGSESDWKTMQKSVDILAKFDIPYEVLVVSAHRTPDRLFDYAADARARGLRVIIAGAGGAAHLPGMLASKSVVPVFGVPVETNYLNGADSLFSIVQMPKGIPVATFAIGETGAFNAALEVVAILAGGDENLTEALYEFRKSQEESVLNMHNRVRKN
ncbi:phosphoribosylaminoimidazolesuccinocarboxamide synthase [Betaproteobacteria bacterium]|nr:phosphoribosylaminoimidazolesuccinocarboxamide synthase [Betaproteobacteria bacterium]